jgi:hypothetical protein
VVAGVTLNGRSADDVTTDADGNVAEIKSRGLLFGPHLGGGLEIGLGPVGLDFEARYVGFLNNPESSESLGGAVQLTAGAVFHF